MAAGPTPPDSRFLELDGLRGIAALAVVVYHFTDYQGGQGVPDPEYIPAIWWGEYGVQLFFLISGFVILMTARRARVVSDFVISRVSRLYPVYWLAVTVGIVLGVVLQLPGTQIGWVDRVANYTMVQRLLLFDNVDPVYWTLAVEMQFYMLIFLVLVITRNSITDRLVIFLAFAWIALSLAVGLVARPHTLGVEPQFVATEWKMLINLLLVEYGPFFAAGMLCYLARKERGYLPLALIALALVPASAWIVRGLEHGVIVAVVVVIFGVVVFRRGTGLLRWRPVQFFGRISYSLYVAHLLPGTAIILSTWPVIGRDLSVLVALVAVTVLAVGYHRLGEVYLTKRFKAALVSLRQRWRDASKSPPSPELLSG
jgi:peptidoglycan/LPS O-acetylase OafA/YrhL